MVIGEGLCVDQGRLVEILNVVLRWINFRLRLKLNAVSFENVSGKRIS